MTTSLKAVDVVAGILQREGMIFLAQRDENRDQAGLWELPGGKIEPGESQQIALCREWREEFGVDITPGKYFASHEFIVSGRRIHLHAWHITAYRGVLVPTCHSQCRWITPENALTLPLAPADVPLIIAFMKFTAHR